MSKDLRQMIHDDEELPPREEWYLTDLWQAQDLAHAYYKAWGRVPKSIRQELWRLRDDPNLREGVLQ